MAGPRRREVPQVGTGDVRLLHQEGCYLLVQGNSAIDVTSIIGMVNYPLGQVALRLRVSSGRPVPVEYPDVAAESEFAAAP